MKTIETKPITVADLKDQIGAAYPRPVLYCLHCGNESSANAGDYWNAPKNHVFTCCGKPMLLGTFKTCFTESE